MARKLRPISHEDRLSLVDHLDELRRRLVISAVTLVATFAFCFWQNDAILKIVTQPYQTTQNVDKPSEESKDPLEQAARFQKEQGQALGAVAPALAKTASTLTALRSGDNLSDAQRKQVVDAAAALAAASKQVAEAAAAVPRDSNRNLVTLGVTEPFTATITVAFYAALLLAMPMILFQIYAFVLPAFSPRERKVALPLMLMVPTLFVGGVLFGYYVVLTRAIEFLQNFNDDSFDILLQAKDYFKFAVLFLGGIGLLFQIPVGVLAVTRLRIVTPKQLAKNRGYVILGIAIVAAVATPTPDPVTMSLAMAPLIVLFELSILLARWIDRIKPPEDDEDADFDFDEDDDLDFDDDADHDDDGVGETVDDPENDVREDAGDAFDPNDYLQDGETFDDNPDDGDRLAPQKLTDSEPKD